jgi:hypothetical protein
MGKNVLNNSLRQAVWNEWKNMAEKPPLSSQPPLSTRGIIEVGRKATHEIIDI